MENLNITSIYKITKTDGRMAFFYTVKQPNLPAKYSYYLLDEGEDQKVTLTKVAHVIESLQTTSHVFSPITQGDNDYDLFVSRLARALKPEIHHENSFPKTYRKIPVISSPQIKSHTKYRRKK